MEDKRLFIQNEEGKEVEYEIILTFTNPDTDIKYVVYKELGDTDDVFAARYQESTEHDGTLIEIETDEEFEMIQEILDSFYDDEEE